MELTDEEKAALTAALDGGQDDDLTIKQWQRLADLGLVVWEHAWELTPAGQIVATLLKREARLERAKAKLIEWEQTADENRQENPVAACATLVWEPSHGWYATVEWAERDERLGPHSVNTCGPADDDPLTAVIEASKRTPWPVEE